MSGFSNKIKIAEFQLRGSGISWVNCGWYTAPKVAAVNPNTTYFRTVMGDTCPEK